MANVKKESLNCIYFHDYFVMAPLKPLTGPFRDLIDVSDFHDYFVMAPLKQAWEEEEEA